MFPTKFVQGSFSWNRTLGQTWTFLYTFPFCTLCKECTVAKRHTIAESALTNVYQTTHSFIFLCYPDHCLSLDCLYTSVYSHHQFFTSAEDYEVEIRERANLGHCCSQETWCRPYYGVIISASPYFFLETDMDMDSSRFLPEMDRGNCQSTGNPSVGVSIQHLRYKWHSLLRVPASVASTWHQTFYSRRYSRVHMGKNEIAGLAKSIHIPTTWFPRSAILYSSPILRNV